MPRSSTAPLTLEVVSLRLLHLPPANYIAEIATDGIRLRKKGSARWFGPASWEQILSAAARTSVREISDDPHREMGVGA
jgi:hypothetical protein